MKWWQGIVVGVVLSLAVILGWLIGRGCSPSVPIEERVDTLYVFDTITIDTPRVVERRVVERVLVPITDTLTLRDTLFVYMDKEQVQWEDSLCRVYASGIAPQVDSVTHFTRETIINREVRVPIKVKSRWGVGVQVGYGVGVADKRVVTSPYVGVGISYNLFTW